MLKTFAVIVLAVLVANWISPMLPIGKKTAY